MAGKNTLPVLEIPLKILKAFTEEKIPFIIVGGAAIALHGIPRSTLDIDIIVPAKGQIIARLSQAAGDIGLLSRDRYISALAGRPHLLIGQWITLQDKMGRELIDVFFEDEKEFNKLLKRSKNIKGEQLGFYIASLADIEKMKKVSARPIDIADIALIKERRNKKI